MELFRMMVGDSPLVSAAIHNGHAIRDDVANLLALSESERLREEDPFTDFIADVAPTRIVGERSRFEVDLNRPRAKAVYQKPEDAWGLHVWNRPLSRDEVDRSVALYDTFYATVETVLSELVARHGRVVVLDVHSYNHLRDGADRPPADAEANPEVNVGTGTMDRQHWAPLVDGFIEALSNCNVCGRRLDVRENVRFFGGDFGRWIHRRFPDGVCAIAVEFKKTFMNEWTGEVDRARLTALRDALASTTPALINILKWMSADARANDELVAQSQPS